MIKVGVSQPGVRALLTRLFQAGLRAVDPYEAVFRQVKLRRGRLTVGPHHYRLHPPDRIVVVGAGKASARMAQALGRRLGARIDTGSLEVVRQQCTLALNVDPIRGINDPIPAPVDICTRAFHDFRE